MSLKRWNTSGLSRHQSGLGEKIDGESVFSCLIEFIMSHHSKSNGSKLLLNLHTICLIFKIF